MASSGPNSDNNYGLGQIVTLSTAQAAIWGGGGATMFGSGAYNGEQLFTAASPQGWLTYYFGPTPVGAAAATSTGVNPVETSYSLYGHTIPLTVFGVGRIGLDIIAGPWIENGLASCILSAGVPADPSGSRDIREIAFDSEVVWSTNGASGVTTPAGGTFNTEPFTFRFYGGTLTQLPDALETDHFGAEANAYRPQILFVLDKLPIANTKFRKIPYVSIVVGDASGDDVNLGEAFERLAYSPWVGMTSSQFETVGITDGLVSGGLIFAQDMEFLQAIQQFGRFYSSWDILQTDKLRIVDRGDNLTADVTLDRTRLMGKPTKVRQEPNSVASIMELTTIDPEADYTLVPSRARRPRVPVAVTTGVRTEKAYLPAIMDSSTRAAVVTLTQYQEEQSREQFSFTAMCYGLQIEPGTIVGMADLGPEFEDAAFKVKETLHGANYSVECMAVALLSCDRSWSTAFSWILNGNATGWGSATLRQVIPAGAVSTDGTELRITVQASNAAGGIAALNHMYIGYRSGSTFDFDGAQVPILFSGSATAPAIPQGASLVSDVVAFTLDKTKDIIISAQFTGAASLGETGAVPGALNGFKPSAAEAASTTVTGYISASGFLELISKIEVR